MADSLSTREIDDISFGKRRKMIMARRPTLSKNQIAIHENDFWIPTLDYNGQVVYIIGGGPSVNDCHLSLLENKNVIAINSSAYKVFEAEITNSLLYFTDSGWWRNNEKIATNWPGKVVTLSKVAKRELPEKILRIQHAQPSIEFPLVRGDSGLVRWGRSSGHTAISLAVAMGASVIVLIGYDMQLIDGQSHHHSGYPRISHPTVYQEFIDHFNDWNRSAKLVGVNIFNTSMNSPLNEFEKISYSQALLLSYTAIPSDISSIETRKYSEEEIVSSEAIDVILNEPDPIQSTKIMGHSNLPIAPHRLSSWLRRK